MSGIQSAAGVRIHAKDLENIWHLKAKMTKPTASSVFFDVTAEFSLKVI